MEEGRLVERSTERELAVVEEEEERNEFDCIEQMKTKKNNDIITKGGKWMKGGNG